MLDKIKWTLEDLQYWVRDKWEENKPYLRATCHSKSFKKVVGVLMAVGVTITTVLTSRAWGVLTFATDLVKIQEEQINMFEAVPKWYEQLPADHWLKTDSDYGFSDCVYCLTHYHQALYSTGSTEFQMFITSLGQTDSKTLEFIGAGLEKHYERNKEQYRLTYHDAGKNVKLLKLKENESKQLEFFYEDIKFLFDFTKGDLEQNIFYKIVYSYMENPEIARIYDGKITGVQKGETTLHLYCNGCHFEYPVKVK